MGFHLINWMNLVFEQHLTGGDRNFGYLLGDRSAKSAALIDPSYDPDLLVKRAKRQGLSVDWILNTHLHHDHVNGNARVKELYPEAKIAAFDEADILLKEGDEIAIGNLSLQIFHVPGHCPDHLVFYQPDFGIAFTGDHLFVGKVGGTWSDEGLRQQFEQLHRLCRTLPPETTIWPGHNVGCRPSSTIAIELASNPFLQAETVEDFAQMKENWTGYKHKMGLL